MAQSIKLGDDIMKIVRRESELQSRSIAGQIAHWVRIGRAIEKSGNFDHARITAALAGDWAAARDVQLELPETGVCSATAGARAIAADAAARLGLPADIPAKLVSAAVSHLATTPDLHTAIQAAPDELGVEPSVAKQLAVLVADQVEAMVDGQATTVRLGNAAAPSAATATGRSGSCCG